MGGFSAPHPRSSSVLAAGDLFAQGHARRVLVSLQRAAVLAYVAPAALFKAFLKMWIWAKGPQDAPA
jgi:hypothetical protein